MTRLITAAVLVIASAGDVAAQTNPSPSRTFGGTGGYGRTWDDEGQIGSGVLIGAYADRRIYRRTDLELSVDYLRHRRSAGESGFFEAEGHTTFLTGAVVQRFGGSEAHGYVQAGLTVGIHSGTAGFPIDNLVTDTDSTNSGLMVGAGFSFRAGSDYEVGPMVKVVVLRADRDSDPARAIMGGIRIGFRR